MNNDVYFDSMPGQRFRQIMDFPGYFIGEHGDVMSIRKGAPRILSLDYNAKGYPRVKLYDKNGAYKHSVHRLVAEAFVPKRHNDRFVDHLNTDVEDNRADNLRWTRTMAENIANPISQEHRRLARRGVRRYNRMSREAIRKRRIEEAGKNTPF